MTPREKFIKCLKREPITGHVPHFELVFYLTMESLKRVHPEHRVFRQWDQMSRREQDMQIQDIAETYIAYAEKYNHSAIFVQIDTSDMHNFDMTRRILEEIRNQSGDKFYTMVHGDPTFAIPNGNDMVEFSARLFEEEDEMKALAQKRVDHFKAFAEKMTHYEGLLDGFTLCSDYCFNTNPFFSPDALHSLDPQGGVDLKEVKARVGNKVALCGNVNCGLLQTGTEEECVADIRRSLCDGMPGYGYISLPPIVHTRGWLWNGTN